MSTSPSAIAVLGKGSAVLLAANMLHLDDDTVAKVKQVISGELKGAAATSVLTAAAEQAAANNEQFRATYVPPKPGPDVVERFVHRMESRYNEWKEKRAAKKAEAETKANTTTAAAQPTGAQPPVSETE